jgi:predicted dithiol-disulfide oxidoreductase (DUF899 family)
MSDDADAQIRQLEREIHERAARLNTLRRARPPTPVKDYSFATLDGPVTLRQLFGEHTTLLAIHNMGQGCRYCTLWADGFNGLVPHLESRLALVLLSRDPPAVQRAFANARGWRFRMASHAGGDYIREQTLSPGQPNAPGLACYTRDGERLFRTSTADLGPGDHFCALWPLLALAGIDENDFTPQFSYWQRPRALDDGGLNVHD